MLVGLLRRPVTAVVGATVAFLLALWQVSDAPIVDLDVYRAGGEAWLAGRGLFDSEFPPRPLIYPLPFIYPPIAAVMFSTFTVLPLKALSYLMTAATVLALLAACVVTARSCGMDRKAALGLGALVCAVMVHAEPVLSTIELGQINVLLMTMVVLDCLLPRTPWPRGLLIGIAAGIKLTPAIFVLYFLASGRWRVVGTVVAAFVGSTVLGFLLDARNSVQYWTETMFKLDTMVGAGFATNQSIRGVLVRFGLDKAAGFPFWAIGVVVVLGVMWFTVRRLLAVGAEVPAMLVIAVAALLCSPISWSNHWVWVAVLGTALAAAVVRTPRWGLIAPGLMVVVYFVGPHRFLPAGNGLEQTWTTAEWFVGNAFFLTAVVAMGVLATRRTTEVPQQVPRYAELTG